MVVFKSEVIWLKPEELQVNDYNPNYMPQSLFEDLIDDIKRNKFYGTILINKDKVIIDGEHRFRALQALKAEKIPCIIEEEAKKGDVLSKTLTIRLNRERGFLLPAETGLVLVDMNKTLPLDILSETTAIPMDELQLLTSIKYDPKLQENLEDDVRIQWSNIESMISNIADKVNLVVKENHWIPFETIVTVSRGGLVPARLLADKLGVKKIHVLRTGETADRDHLFVEDIYDTGKTYRKFAKSCKIYASLFIRNGQVPPKNAIFSNVTEGDEYIVFPWDKIEYRKAQTSKKREQSKSE